MALGLALFYWGGALPPRGFPALLGLAFFGALALLRPDLGLLFVPLTAPLYLIPAAIQGLRADPFRVPLHEAALLAVFAATAVRWLWQRVATNQERAPARSTESRDSVQYALRPAHYVLRYAPHIVFLVAGILGVLIAVERSRALREFRWTIAEPLIFYALVKSQVASRKSQVASDRKSAICDLPPAIWILIAFVLGGAIVGLLGLLQYAGLDLVPLLGRKECFASDGGPCANVVEDAGVRRVLSVYGHPNNLGLYLGRVWPVAAALAILDFRFWILDLFGQSKIQNLKSKMIWFWVLASLLCLGGIVVSFSRGAWLGAVAAAAVLALGLTADDRRQTEESSTRSSFVLRLSSLKWLLGVGVGLVVLAGLALSIRGDVTAGSTPVRLLLWREALGYIGRHPLGIGLDQFGYYHDPNSGLSLIDPSLIGASEQYAPHPHNLLLDTWLRMGPLGLIAFGWLLARCFRTAMRRIPAPIALGAAAALGAALAHGLVDSFYFVSDLALAFWLLIALVETLEG